MRIDRALFWLRFCKSRGLAQKLVEAGHLRCNGIRIARSSHEISAGDILTFPIGKHVRLIEIVSLPTRRGPARETQQHYRSLDPAPKTELAAKKHNEPSRGHRP